MGTQNELKPDECLTTALVSGSEKYELLSQVYSFIDEELKEIKENGFKASY